MDGRGSDDKGTLAPIYPSEAPSLPDTGRRWVALFLLVVFISGFVVSSALWIVGLF
ncbi:hypothetical protein J2751_002105 [Halorubrum alkaliphilum]|uniref:Uncharacterized protein n=1 Tax=Halorubrum alkaliphilum TaxID=261290 RepID=A0A8T4GEY8_9EURY|nr:hypothetical protein [Halorubrum alkaliphilum]MBP1923068.1 hypothetical protein [Halorubrum alkaliphilum]